MTWCAGAVLIGCPGQMTEPSELADAGAATASDPEAAAPSAAADYCEDEKAFVDRCVPSRACGAALQAQCPERAAFYSDAYKAAFHACAPAATCTSAGLDSACVTTSLKKETPSDAQHKLAVDFCRSCAAGAAVVRDEGLACAGRVIRGTGRTLGPYLLALSDPSAVQVGTACIAKAHQAFPDDYDNCENHFLNCLVDQMPPDPAACR